MDLGLSPCACGLLGPEPFSSPAEGPLPRPSLAEGLKVNARLKARDPKGKAPLGYKGPQPKLVFKPNLRKKAMGKGLGAHPKKDTGGSEEGHRCRSAW